MSAVHLKKGEVIDLPIRRIGINGEGIGFYKKQVVFVDGAVPGEYVSARVTEVKKRFAKGKMLRLKKRSSHRVRPTCPVYRECGGCRLQHIDYPMQLRLKRELVEEAFSRYTSLDSLPIEETVGMDRPRGYRNKAQLPVRWKSGKVRMGMYSAGSHRLIDYHDCEVQHPETNAVLKAARQVLEELSIPIYDERSHRGGVRHLVARYAFDTGEAQLVVVSRDSRLPREKALVEALIRRLPQLKGIILNVNPHRTSVVFGENSRVLWGKEKVTERLGDRIYHLSAPAFFQLNPVQTEKLYDEVKKAANLTGSELLVDAYCGAGTIGVWLAEGASKIVGMDTVPEAIRDAEYNARQNGVKHAEYYLGAAEDLLSAWVDRGTEPDVVVADPPRTGLGRPLIETLTRVKVSRFVYVSCNPSTLAKDCDQLIRGGYSIKRVVPVDMFPQTSHVESCTLLEWTGSGSN
ncbi:23S rRNA (uracil(1939)-C(5))-methyltransferase RlmD [Paludifilum halophilum]|uniref:23S rRNA (Uracil(1939)-C(5))-methyltransferase RlmD n=1 Tax=Paludifilum halophilum TaxID=1642702 RepID=A0A235BA14_9BACL|nr:23S rRNA (uracil(1939)-C(5))-methyltransferase RlmD [Paludifilum halophilum]OYD09134.1 23S rRNA (uracil(1939)-C(5))-methyltransferase RlmD [Paludifilum halophilum]